MNSRLSRFNQIWVWIETPGMSMPHQNTPWEQRLQRMDQACRRLKKRFGGN